MGDPRLRSCRTASTCMRVRVCTCARACVRVRGFVRAYTYMRVRACNWVLRRALLACIPEHAYVSRSLLSVVRSLLSVIRSLLSASPRISSRLAPAPKPIGHQDLLPLANRPGRSQRHVQHEIVASLVSRAALERGRDRVRKPCARVCVLGFRLRCLCVCVCVNCV